MPKQQQRLRERFNKGISRSDSEVESPPTCSQTGLRLNESRGWGANRLETLLHVSEGVAHVHLSGTSHADGRFGLVSFIGVLS